MRHGTGFPTALSTEECKTEDEKEQTCAVLRRSPRSHRILRKWGSSEGSGLVGRTCAQSRSRRQGDPNSPAKSSLPPFTDQTWCSPTRLARHPSRAAFGKEEILRSHFCNLRCYRPQGFLLISSFMGSASGLEPFQPWLQGLYIPFNAFPEALAWTYRNRQFLSYFCLPSSHFLYAAIRSIVLIPSKLSIPCFQSLIWGEATPCSCRSRHMSQVLYWNVPFLWPQRLAQEWPYEQRKHKALKTTKYF